MCPCRKILIYKIDLLLAEIDCRIAGLVSVSAKPPLSLHAFITLTPPRLKNEFFLLMDSALRCCD